MHMLKLISHFQQPLFRFGAFWATYWVWSSVQSFLFKSGHLDTQDFFAAGLMFVHAFALGKRGARLLEVRAERWIEMVAVFGLLFWESDMTFVALVTVGAITVNLWHLKIRVEVVGLATVIGSVLMIKSNWWLHQFYPLQILGSWLSLGLGVSVLLQGYAYGIASLVFGFSYLCFAFVASLAILRPVSIDAAFLLGPDLTPFGLFVVFVLSQFTVRNEQGILRPIVLGGLVGIASVGLRWQGMVLSSLVSLMVLELAYQCVPSAKPVRQLA